MLKKLRRTLIGQYCIHMYHAAAAQILPRALGDEKAIRSYYRRRAGYEPNLEAPKTFSEKQQYYKLRPRLALMERCADKFDVRTYVTECGFEGILNECLGLYSSVEELDIADLPDEFVLKATHGSGFNLIVTDKRRVNWRAWRRIMRAWLRQDIYWSGREWVYRNLPRRIMAERYLQDESGGLRDYKFFCFNGVPTFVQVEAGRYAGERVRNFYDMHWQLLPFGKEIPHDPSHGFDRPISFGRMRAIAAALSSPFTFVRVDLYEVNETPLFGELTFFPAGGAPDFVPREYDRIVGDMWKFPSCE